MADLNRIHEAIVKGNLALSVATTKEALAEETDPQLIIREYMIPAMNVVGDMFEKGEAFVPELLLAARAMKGSLDLIRPLLTATNEETGKKVIIGTVQGDLHDIGKNIVASMLEGAGYTVINLGNDVKPAGFVEAIRTHNPGIVAMSALLTTTMTAMETTVNSIREAGLRDRVKIVVGGAPVTEAYCKMIGADGYSDNANGAVRVVRELAG
jgi:5-methyltetrahydrofolate--homocysteine methyltransferase